MASVKHGGERGKRRRASDKSGRRFTINRDASRRKGLPSPATLPRKKQRAQNTFRTMVAVALFCVFMSTMLEWRRRIKRQLGMDGTASQNTFQGRFEGSTMSDASLRKPNDIDFDQEGGNASSASNTSTSQENTNASSALAESQREDDDASLSFEELPERIEWYSRTDFKDGSRPMCRISKPYILSNGTIVLPDWMEKYERLLHRCGLGNHGFYPTDSGPVGLERTREIAADFALTVHPEKFQEPTHDPSVYLTEHILKSSYLFDVFSGKAQPLEGKGEHHCYTLSNDSTCALPRPARTLLAPAIFVPKKIELGPKSLWSRDHVEMFGAAHGHGKGVIHLNASSILIKEHQGLSENLLGTSFRSIMTMDGMFRHLPAGSLKRSSFYSTKNGIQKSPKNRDAPSDCKITVGIASPTEPLHGIQAVDEIKDKIEVLGKLALAGASIDVKKISYGSVTLADHITEIQDLDLFLGGSGDEMSSIGYMRQSASALELMPFGIKPKTHESLARALDIKYHTLRGKPEVEAFKACLDGEVFNLRKKGTLKFTESPEWQQPVMQAWEEAVSEFVLSGSSNLDILSAGHPVNNYHARVCAQRQKIDISPDDIARQIIRMAKDTCSPQ